MLPFIHQPVKAFSFMAVTWYFTAPVSLSCQRLRAKHTFTYKTDMMPLQQFSLQLLEPRPQSNACNAACKLTESLHMLMLPSRTSSGTFHSFPYRMKSRPSSFPLGSRPQLCKPHHKHLLFTPASQEKHPNISYLTWPKKLPCLYSLTLSAADTKTYM